MATEFHDRVRRIIEAALQQPAKQRDEFITQAARGDGELAREVRAILPHYLEVAGYDPRRPGGKSWRLPGTTTFSRTIDAGADDLDWTPPFSIAPYTVVEVLGRGGMGVVFRGIDATRRHEVAIKVLRRRLRTRADRLDFKREQELLRQLRHPGIVRFLHGGIARIQPRDASAGSFPDRRPYFVMDYVRGQPLVDYSVAKDLNALQRIALLVQVCEAVQYAHYRGVIHRDLKPDNILVDEHGQPKILDFGIAKLQEDTTSADSERQQFTGTLAYASPEQLAGHATTLTPASDVYTLGLIACELLCGRVPANRTERLTLDLRCAEPRQGGRRHASSAPSEFRQALALVLSTALRQTPGRQYANAGELGSDLATIVTTYATPGGWRTMGRRLAAFLQRGSAARVTTSGPLLRAILRKRLGMALDDERDTRND